MLARLNFAYWAGAITLALLLLVAALIRLIPPDPEYIRATFTVEHVELLNLFDNRGQQWAHRALAGLLGALVLGLWVARPGEIGDPPAGVAKALGLLVRYGGIPIAILCGLVVTYDGRPPSGNQAIFHGRYALFPVLSAQTYLLLALLGFVGAYAWTLVGRFERAHRLRGAAVATGAVYLLALAWFGMSRQPSFLGFGAELIAGVEWHYGGAVASADRIGIGERLGEVPIHSSLLGSVLLGIWQHVNGLLDFGGHIRVLAVLQSLMLAIVALSCAHWYRWRAGAWLVGMLLVTPWIQPMQAAVLYPNQSAWRFLGLCFGVATLVLVRKASPAALGVVLGLAGGFAGLWNVETGVALNFAYCVLLVLRNLGARAALCVSFIAYTAGLIGALLGFCLIVRFGLGYWPDLAAILGSFPLIGNFSLGYGGLAFTTIDLLALAVFTHALFLVVRGALQWAVREVQPPRECARIALAAMLVVWAGYYFKAPHPWNLWTALLIYAYLIGDVHFASPESGVFAGAWKRLVSPASMVFCVVFLPAIIASNAITLSSLGKAVRQRPCPEASVVSGICLPVELAESVRKKAASLRAHAAKGPILYLTADVYLMPLVSGVAQPLRQRDAFSDSVRPADFSQLVSDIRLARAACILYDDPASPLSGYASHRKFYARLRATLASEYERRGTADGWEIHCRSGVA